MEHLPVRRKLRMLHRILSAGRFDYEHASERARSQEVRGLLYSLSSGRLLMVHELERELEHLKGLGPLKRSAKLMAVMQRRWSAICAVLTAPGDREVLRACEQGEWYTVNVLRSMLLLPGLHGSTRDVLSRMEKEVSGNLSDILLLESGSLGLA